MPDVLELHLLAPLPPGEPVRNEQGEIIAYDGVPVAELYRKALAEGQLLWADWGPGDQVVIREATDEEIAQ